ncbi:MAG: tetratricopeptide repeat protein [Pseudomonadota bacterium]
MRMLLVLLLLSLTTLSWATDVHQAVHELQKQWAIANYETQENQYEQVFAQLNSQAEKTVKEYPGQAEPLIWQAIILSTDAGKNGGFSALGKVKQSKKLLLEAEKINPKALDGSIYTSLGSLYYQVPGWPIGFGDNDQALVYLKKALEMNPNGIDPNYFYGDFLLEKGQYKQAVKQFNKALQAADRPARPLADKGRRLEINAKLKTAQSNL